MPPIRGARVPRLVYPASMSPRAAPVLIFVLVVAAYLPSLGGDFLWDDGRFVKNNEAVHRLTPLRYFTDPGAQATVGWQGIYRPLRTLDFAIDWQVSGGSPLFFHLRNVLYHVLASLLVLALLRLLLREKPVRGFSPAVCGALVYAVHPVQTEAVAWITSRGDLLLAVFFVAALVLHLKGRRVLVLPLLVLALLSKESAVVFPAAALLADRLRGDRPAWLWYAAYAGVAAAYAVFWFVFVGGGDVAAIDQVPYWWGGSRLMGAATFVKGCLYYGKLFVLPVDLVADYHLPARRVLDAGTVISLVLAAGVVAGAWRGGRRMRFALAWFLVTILPVSGLLYRMQIPTAERFLLLPSIGLCLVAGGILARTRLRHVVFACFAVLVFARCFAWRSDPALWEATLRVADTPTALTGQALRDLDSARASGRAEDARRVIERADAFHALFRDDFQLAAEATAEPVVPLEMEAVLNRAKVRALLLLDRDREALDLALLLTARAGGAEPEDHLVASEALEKLGRFEEAAAAAAEALRGGLHDPGPQVARLADLLYREGARREALAGPAAARSWYEESWRVLPDPAANPNTRAALDRLR